MKYLTKDEVASLLRVSVRTVTTYMGQGLLPQPFQLGRKLLWDEGALIQFIQPKPVLANHTSEPAKRGRPRKVVAL
ncbi:helix-turn-helix transcriptional regulator [Massilia sp. LXY-6]|uniref:helix-turn-helix transcriptional regulator n=1 Tax=Massilia sp. LXY-6 TaxID=3379823 RepID=UPI003EE2D420